MGHWEMLGAMILQCMRGCTCQELTDAGLAGYYTLHNHGVFPADPNGVPFSTSMFAVTGDPIADIVEDMAAEQKARSTYDNILRLADDPDVKDAIRFLRQREIVHFQRFGEGLRIVQDNLNAKNFYACNPAFNRNCGRKTRM